MGWFFLLGIVWYSSGPKIELDIPLLSPKSNFAVIMWRALNIKEGPSVMSVVLKASLKKKGKVNHRARYMKNVIIFLNNNDKRDNNRQAC
ncbi:hypothetical protein PanWU01x14_120530 [Parasponia andersonii]|uniref:Uncharacterized protein n=1 Tax=Parasponia andersonii TaxID=3476 RepID=A0A2P5CV74_PARAD|nr:hypothetical protein PanWU01x14_120530 [Parasponia andersonii]